MATTNDITGDSLVSKPVDAPTNYLPYWWSKANVKENKMSFEEAYEQTERGFTSNYDNISNPSHYTCGRNHEPADVIRDWQLNFFLGNVVKYISRAGRKGDAKEDLKKALWYLNKELENATK